MGRRCADCDIVLLADVWTQVLRLPAAVLRVCASFVSSHAFLAPGSRIARTVQQGRRPQVPQLQKERGLQEGNLSHPDWEGAWYSRKVRRIACGTEEGQSQGLGDERAAGGANPLQRAGEGEAGDVNDPLDRRTINPKPCLARMRALYVSGG
jgi:hypothetical protein